MALPLHARAKVDGPPREGLFKVLGLPEALTSEFAPEKILVDLRCGGEVTGEALVDVGFAGVVGGPPGSERVSRFHSVSNDAVVSVGDVIRLRADGRIDVLFRRGANANALFVTETCNSICVMCSQPPRDIDDGWRLAELAELVSLVDRDIQILGVTGGEPTLLGRRLAELLEGAARLLPTAQYHVLSNGRRVAQSEACAEFDGLRGRIVWAVPVYGDAAADHDRVTGVAGSFAETMHGLYNLAERGHRIEIRMVLSALTLPRLAQTAEFYCRNLPFVEHVALMGLEPMGFARVNAKRLDYDPSACGKALLEAVSLLDQAGMSVSIYNVPLCTIDDRLHRFARRSISDWKSEFAVECGVCRLKPECCGFFRSAGQSWRRAIRPVLEADT